MKLRGAEPVLAQDLGAGVHGDESGHGAEHPSETAAELSEGGGQRPGRSSICRADAGLSRGDRMPRLLRGDLFRAMPCPSAILGLASLAALRTPLTGQKHHG